MQKSSYYIHTTKYRLQIKSILESKKMEIVLASKINNGDAKYWVGTVPDEWMEGDEEQAYRRLKRFCELHVQPFIFVIRQNKKESELLLQDHTSGQYNKKQALIADQEINYGIKYWEDINKIQQVNVVFDPHQSQIRIFILRLTSPKTAVQAIIKADSFPTHQESLINLFNDLQKIELQYSKTHLILNHQLLNSVPLLNSVAMSEQGEQQQGYQKFPGKMALFRHIFLTEVIIHMIVSQFGRIKWKHIEEREGWNQSEYDDLDLEAFRTWGYRMYEFRDHPIKKKKKKRKKNDEKELDSLDEEEDESESESENEENEKQDTKEKKENKKTKKPKTILQKMGVKIKEVIKNKQKQKQKETCNFTFISGYEKSKINKVRYCLCQMTRQTDHTQALMDFLRLIFRVVPRKELVGNGISQKEKYFEQGSDNEKTSKESSKKGLMSEFLSSFRVKRMISSCFFEYTKPSFFHKILNIGLRVLDTPDQLVYIRLPFSHIFWSIKFLYHRHKRAIFLHKQKKNQKRTITLYRGCSVSEKEVDKLKINVGCYIEAEGFLSTSLRKDITEKFAQNLMMVIEVPVVNLKGMFDNGFADISQFSFFPTQRQVLINAFNVFKVLSFKKANKDQKNNVIRLQYGSIKAIENKVKKSEDLLDKEYLWNVDHSEISLIKKKLEVNEERMSKHWHTKLTKILIPEEKRLWERRKKLQEQTEKQYQQAVKNLNQWDKQLLLNTKHQQQKIAQIQNYGDLLFDLGEYRKGCIYSRRKLKQMELDMAVEGAHWRKNQCLIYKQHQYRYKLQNFYMFIGRATESYEQLEKLLDIYVSVNTQESHENYYQLIYCMYIVCLEVAGKQQENKKLEEQLMRIFIQYELKNTEEYKLLMEARKKNQESQRIKQEKQKKKEKLSKRKKKQIKQEKKKRKAARKQQIKQIKKQLKRIKLKTYGLYSYPYLQELWSLIHWLYIWERWRSVLKQGSRYLQIRNLEPHLQCRKFTCAVLEYMVDACTKRRKKGELQAMCTQVVSFTHSNIHSYKEYYLLLLFIQSCIKLDSWIVGKPVVSKLMQVGIKCKLPEKNVHDTLTHGYTVLLMSGSEWGEKEKFLNWIVSLYEQQEYTKTWQYDRILKHILEYNDEYNKSDDTMYNSRKKEWFDAQVIKYVYDAIKEKGYWSEYMWRQTNGQLMQWKHPLHQLHINAMHCIKGTGYYLERGDMNMTIKHFLQMKNGFYNMMEDDDSTYYLRILCSISKLHLNSYHFHTIPSLLSFDSNIDEVYVVQMWEIGLDLERTISTTQHLTANQKLQTVQSINRVREVIFKSGGKISHLNLERPEVRQIRQMHRRYKRYSILTAKLSSRKRPTK